MNPEALNDQLKREPYIPLRLTLTTGEAVNIMDSVPVYINQLCVNIFGVKRRGDHIADSQRIISLRHIVKIEQIEMSPTS